MDIANKQPGEYGILDFLASIDDLNDQSVVDFYNKLSPEGKAVLEEVSVQHQLILAALSLLTPEQLQQLTHQKCKHTVLVHDLNNLVQLYYSCIGV